MEKQNSIFINRLENNIPTNIAIFSHNSVWPYLQVYEDHYNNCSIDVYGESLTYIGIQKKKPVESDIILFFSSKQFEEDELNKLKEIAFSISEEKQKRVSIGYSYMVPKSEREDESIADQVKLVSFKNSIEDEETTWGINSFNIFDLLEMTLSKHNELEHQMTIKKTNL